MPRRSRRRRPPRGSRFDCRKVRYRDKIAALIALAKIQYNDPAGHTEKRAYFCPQCGGWHLTSQA